MIKIDLYTMKEVYSLLESYELEFLIDSNFKLDQSKIAKALKKRAVVSELVLLISDKKEMGFLDSIKTIKKFFKLVSRKWDNANTLLSEMKGGKSPKNVIMETNIYLDLIRQITEIYNIDPRLLDFDQAIYFLYRHNMSMEEERKKAERERSK